MSAHDHHPPCPNGCGELADECACPKIATQDDSRKANLTIPLVRIDRTCGDLGPRYSCNRPKGHGGRHSYVWRNAGCMSGRVREVWR